MEDKILCMNLPININSLMNMGLRINMEEEKLRWIIWPWKVSM